MIVQHNLTAMNSNRMLGLTTKTQAKSTEKLSSGYKINRAADDAAGLSISEKMRKQIRGLTQASANAQDGISAVQTAEGALTEVHDMLQRMNELAVKAGNGTMSETDRQSVQDEIDQLITEIDRVSETTKFNETYLLKGEGQSKKLGENSAHIGSVTDGKDRIADATIVQAKGNIFSGTMNMATDKKLDTGTEDTATITYLDENGDKRSRDVVFKTGKDAEATAKNLAEAINNDDVLKHYFKASGDTVGKLSVESKLDGRKTDDTKNAVQAIQFASVNATDSAARYNSFTEVTAKSDMINNAADVWSSLRSAAVGESYAFEIKATQDVVGQTVATDALGTSVDAQRDLKDGNSITINGKTYTYDANKTSNDANSFKTLEELQKLVGDDYIVSAQITAKQVLTTYGAANTNKTDADGEEVSVEIKDAGKKVDVGAFAASDFNDLKTEAFAANSTKISGYKDVKITLNIAEKSSVDKAKDVLNFSLQVGADTTEENKISVDIQSMSAKSLGIDKVSVTGKDSTNADEAVNTIADAIAQVSKQRSALGAIQNRLEHTINNLDNVVENTTSAEAAIRDTDMASEMVKYSNNNILAQAGQAMLAQANQSNQGVLSLLG
ncbi:MAG: flagellar hook protein [bacterium]|nr:flagellar hook protein [bacterium]